MGVPSGGNLGAAQGSITINTNQLAQAQAQVNAFAANTTKAMGSVSAGVNRVQGSIASLAGAFGVGLGVQGISQLVRAAADASKAATAFDRQSIAAENLAGSQGKLNAMMEVYDRATGGIVDKATALQNVTKLMAVGFGDSAGELEKFATAIRGISIAMGMSQKTVTQNLVLELFTQRGMRLDQLGLQYDKVRQRADELQAADSSLTDQMAYQNAVLEQANARFGGLTKSAKGQGTEVEKLERAWANLRLEMAQAANPAINAFAKGVNDELQGVRATVQGLTKDFDNLIKKSNEYYGRGTGGSDPIADFLTADPIGDFADRADQRFAAWLAGLTGQLTEAQRAFVASSDVRHAQRRARGGGVTGPPIIEGEAEAKLDWARGVRDINDQLHDDIIEAESDYGRQRADTIRSYQKGVAREERDFNRNRLRDNLNFLDSVADVYRDQSRRESKATEDLARTLGKAREDNNERLADLEEDYLRDREKRAEKHRDDILEAAGRLDAKAIAEAQRNFRRQEKDAKESYDDQRKETQEQLQERIDEATEAHQRQLEEARQADAERLADMKADFAKRQAQEDEDRAIRNADRAQDHTDQLAEMDRAHAERLAQINRQAAEELQQHNEDHEAEMVRLRAADEAMRKRVEARDKILMDSWDKFWKKVQHDLDERNSTVPRTQSGGPVRAFASGGFVPRDMLARLHAGEMVIPAAQVAGGNMGGRNISLDGTTFNIYAAPGQSPDDIGYAVRFHLEQLLKEVAA